MADKKYVIAKGISITSKGIVLDAGTEVTAENFANKESFEAHIKAKNIVEAGAEKKAAEKTDAGNTNGKDAGKDGKPSGDGGNAGK